MKKRILVGVVIALVAAAAIIFAVSKRNKRDDGAIRFSGNVEVTEIELSFRVPGRVVARPVDEGMQIRRGAVVAVLDTTTFQHEVELRAAALEAARAQLLQLEHGSRPEEIRTARAALNAAEAQADRWKSEQARERKMLEDGILPKQNFEVADTSYRSAREQAEQARQALDLVEKGPRIETIEQARAQAGGAEAALASARTQLSFTTLTSPVNGIVLSKQTEAGEQVALGTPIVTVADLQNVWIRGYIDETDLGRIRLGQKVRVTTDTYPGKVYQGIITFISSDAEFTPKSVQTAKERVKLVYRIKVTVDNRSLELKPGMPADGEIALPRS
jgi:HlyD family secretion protein